MGDTAYGMEDLEAIVGKLKEFSIKLNIIPLDFMESYDIEENIVEGEGFLDKIQ